MNRAKLRKLVEIVESSHIRTRWVLLSIVVSGVLAYLNTLGNAFIFDDWQQIVENPFLRRPDALAKIFTTGVWQFLGQIGISNFYRPLMHAMFYGGFHLFGLNPAGYHAVSIVLHALVSLLVYLLIVRLTGDRLTSGFAAALFAVHPVHTEAVAWISAYPELLCALFSLLAMWLYLTAEASRMRRRNLSSLDPYRRLLLLLATGPLLFLALLAKEIAVAVPVLLAACEFLRARTGQAAVQRQAASAGATVRGGADATRANASPAAARRAQSALRGLVSAWPAYASMAAAIAAYLAARIHALGALMPAATRTLPLGENIWTAFAVFWRYFQVQLFPIRLHAFYYLKPNSSPVAAPVIAGIALSVGLAAGAWWLRRKNRPEAWAIPLYVLPLAPALLLPYAPIGLLMAERYVYLSSLAFCWGAGALLAGAIRRWGYRRLAAAFVVLFVAYSVRTVSRNEDWRDEIAFYQQTIRDFPGFPRAYLNLGEALMRRDRLAEAREVSEKAIQIDPSYPDPHMNLGLICRLMGDENAAEAQFRQAVSLGRERGNHFVVSRALANLAATYRASGRVEESVTASKEALGVDPLFPGAHNNLAFALITLNRPDEAIQHLKQALELDPTLDVAWSNLGLAYWMKGDSQTALESLHRAERMNPGNAETHARIAEVLLRLGRFEEAVHELTFALQLDPKNERAQRLNPGQALRP